MTATATDFQSNISATAGERGGRPLKVAYFGAAPDTANLGVSALCISVLQEMFRDDPRHEITVFDYGRGGRQETFESAEGRHTYKRVGAKLSRRYWQRETFWNIRWSHRLGGLGNEAVRVLREADVVFDISGGDSFTDLYGSRRFASVSMAKELALEMGKPLVLLPQTYGPFNEKRTRDKAADIVRRSAVAWARDERSYATLKELAGRDFDPARHKCGVDVAFALETRAPTMQLPGSVATWLSKQRKAETIGFNVSGLIWHDPAAMRGRYGFKADYREVVLGFLRRALVESDANILLIPHVITAPGHYESDPGANEAVRAALADDGDARVRRAASERVEQIPMGINDPREMKWVIGRCDWFCGTRMHACIAGLSSGVPTAAIAYSIKTIGVFETCGEGESVIDPRSMGSEAVANLLWERWQRRAATAANCLGAADAVERARGFTRELQTSLCERSQSLLAEGVMR